MALQDVLAKFNLVKTDLSDFEIETRQVLTNIYNTLSGKTFLDRFVNDPRDFNIIFENDTAYADVVSGPNGLEHNVYIDFSWIPNGILLLSESGDAQAISAEVILTHELTHMLLGSDDPVGYDLDVLMNPETNKGEMVIQENLIAADLNLPQRISINAISGQSSTYQSITQLIEGYDYTPGADNVDVIFTEIFYSFPEIDLSQHSQDNSYLLVMGGGNHTITGSDNIDFIHTSGGDDTVFGSLGNDYLDGGADTDALDYSKVTESVLFKLLTPAAGIFPAEFSVEGSDPDPMTPHNWTDTVMNFEVVNLTEKTDVLQMNGNITEWASMKIFDGGSGSIEDAGTVINIEAYSEEAVTGFTAYGDVLSLEQLSVSAGDEVRVHLDDRGDRYSVDQASGYVEHGGSYVEIYGFDDVIGSGAGVDGIDRFYAAIANQKAQFGGIQCEQ